MIIRTSLSVILSCIFCLSSAFSMVPFESIFNNAFAQSFKKTAVEEIGSVASIIHHEADKQGVPRAFAIKVAKRESGLRCNAYNPNGHTFGLFQLKPATARGLGFKGAPNQLYNCNTAAHYGVKHLAICYRLAKGDWSRANFCHRAGFRAISGRHSVEHEIKQALNVE